MRDVLLDLQQDTNRAVQLLTAILAELRLFGCFSAEPPDGFPYPVVEAQRAFAKVGWTLSSDGDLEPDTFLNLTGTSGRPVIEVQLKRLQKATDDPALLIGTAKEMLESTGRYVLEHFGVPGAEAMDFNSLWFHTRDRLGIHPKNLVITSPAGQSIRKILSASWTIAEQVNELRKEEGTGHGRTLPTGVTAEMALLVVREACNVAEFCLTTLDRQMSGARQAQP